MSRVGKNPVAVPAGVTVQVAGRTVTAKGQLGELAYEANELVNITQEDSKIWVKPVNETKEAQALWGTARARVANLVKGVSTGFTRSLEITGVGYRAEVQGKTLNLKLGFSHDVNYPIPPTLKVVCERPTAIQISGADKSEVGQFAAEIRGLRGPEPYKGKGVRYADEVILRKEGKKK